MANKDCPYSTGCPVSTYVRTTSPATSDSISFINFMASMMHRGCPTSTTSPSLTKGGALGDGES